VVRPVADSEGVILSQLRLLLWFITLLALAASGLAISGAMTASVLERRGEIALMKAVGAQDSAIGALFFSEAALLGLGGGAVGYLLGEWLATAIAYHVLGHSIAWKPALAPLMLVLAALVALAGSLHPLRQAIRVEPAVALRGEA
jgi:putative ABC transport system permease protein